MNAKGFMDLVEDVRRSAFEPQAWRPSKEKYANNTVDEEFLSHWSSSIATTETRLLKDGFFAIDRNQPAAISGPMMR